MNATVRCLSILVLSVLPLTGGTAHAQAQTPAKGYAEVNGTRLYYEVAGKGPTVVLVHGGLVDSRLWDDQMKPFAKGYRVVRYDLRGFGKSASATEAFSHIEDLRALLDFLGIERTSVVGLSLGGVIAADFALEYPNRVERLVLSGPGLRGDKQPPDKEAIAAYQAASQGAEAFVSASMKTSLYAAVRPNTVAYARLRQMMLDNFKALPTFVPGFLKYPQQKTIERLGNIHAPTLVVIGSEDSETLKNIAATLQTKIPGARKVVIRGVSHHPPVEKPSEFNRIVMDFLRQTQMDGVRSNEMLSLVEAERAFAQAAGMKGTRDAFLEFLADDGIIFQPGPVNGKQFWRDRPARKGLLSWEPIFADVSAAGDLGYTTGPYEFRPNGPDDKPVAFGRYFSIWKKQSDGSWKVVLDRGTNNPPPSATAEFLQFPKDDRGVSRNVKTNVEAGRTLLLRLENEFSQAALSKGIAKAFRSYLADDVRLLREKSFPAVGKQAALAAVTAKSGALTWRPVMADVSRSGDLGYTYGTYEFKSPNVEPKTEKGNYVRVWKRESNGRWKVIVDILNPVPPG